MRIVVAATKRELGRKAAAQGADLIRRALRSNGSAAIIVATGMSQFEVLANLAEAPDIRWDKVTAFHLDEYVGLPITHPASFRQYLWARFVRRLPLPLAAFHYIDAGKNPPAECDRLNRIIARHAIDLAFLGIGENGHLAFNDPPADFRTTQPYIVVRLDDACRRQQLNEGWFPTFKAVPDRAISMSCRQIMKSRAIICVAPDRRKAPAVKASLEGPVTPEVPASILQQHRHATIFLDGKSAALLEPRR